ncbi:MAG: septum site-determining protein MinC [Bacillota bacterium]
MVRNSSIEFKGTKDGISIIFDENVELNLLKQHLIEKLESGKQFFQGAKVIGFQGKTLTEDEKSQISEIIHDQYGMTFVEKTEEVFERKEKFYGIEEGLTKFIRATIRSGQRICFQGNIVIIGDVNPGAEIVAEGNIVVMGTMRGVAHAGSSGNEKAFVAAYNLQPTQLRIADVIARSPDEQIKPICPEMAIVKENIVVIEPYLPNK